MPSFDIQMLCTMHAFSYIFSCIQYKQHNWDLKGIFFVMLAVLKQVALTDKFFLEHGASAAISPWTVHHITALICASLYINGEIDRCVFVCKCEYMSVCIKRYHEVFFQWSIKVLFFQNILNLLGIVDVLYLRKDYMSSSSLVIKIQLKHSNNRVSSNKK